MTLDDLRDALGRDPTRDDIRKLEIMAEFRGFDVREFLDGDRYRFEKRTGRKPRKMRRGQPRRPYGIRHRVDCPFPDGQRVVTQSGRRRCLSCVMAARHARCLARDRQRCVVCERWFAHTPNRSKTCGKRCRYKLSSASRTARDERSMTCKRGHAKSDKPRRDGYHECLVCKRDRQKERRALACDDPPLTDREVR